MNELVIDGKTYISSKRAAEITGYAKDYVGQLCREGRIDARLVGRNWYVLEESVREHRFGKVESIVVEELEAGSVKKTTTWSESRYHTEVPTAIPTLNERLNAVEESSEIRNDVNTGVLTDMQAAWQEWFSRKEEGNTINIERGEAAVEISALEEDEARASESKEETEIDAEATESSTIDSNDEVEEESSEVLVTLHRTNSEPEEVLDLSQVTSAAQDVDEDTEEDGYIVHEEILPSRKGNYVVLKAALVVVMLAVVAVTAIGTGLVSKYDNYGLSRISEIRYIAGVSEYNN